MECRIKFIGKESYDKKSFSSVGKALAFIDKNFKKIDCVNNQPLRIYTLKGWKCMADDEIHELLLNHNPFARSFYSKRKNVV